MKKFLILALVASLTFSSLTACSNNETKETEDSKESITESETEEKTNRLPAVEVSGEGFEFALSEDKSYYIFAGKGTCSDEKLTVPAKFKDLPVKSIAENAFAACEDITEITVSDGITEIGKNAFAYAKDLKSVTLPNSLTEISKGSFYSCEKLEAITLGSTTNKIGNSAFENCTSLKAITLPNTVKEVGLAAFYNCSALADIKLGDSIEKISASAFDKTAYVSNTQNWQDKALYCGKYLLKVATDKADALNVKDGTLLIADHAATQSAITEINIPASLKFIGATSFTACQKLTDVKVSEGVISIDNNAFSSCDSLVSVTLPNTLTNLGAYAFYHCSALKSIVIPNGVTSISDQVFNECAALESITLPDTLESIGVYSFANCYSLIKITFPDSLKVIGESSFYKCYNLLSINLPKNLEKIEGWAFQHCQKLLDVKNESKLEIVAKPEKNENNGYVGTYANEIHNGESKIIEQNGYLFYSYNNKNYLVGYNDMTATELTLPESFGGKNYIVYKYAFSFRPTLQKATVTSGATAFNSYSFDDCPALAELTFGKSVTSIAKNAINICPAFSKITFIGTEAEFNSINVNATNPLFLAAQVVYS